MGKLFMGAAIGVFVGAFAVELLNRKRPGALKSFENKVGEFATSLSDAFRAGYQGVR